MPSTHTSTDYHGALMPAPRALPLAFAAAVCLGAAFALTDAGAQEPPHWTNPVQRVVLDNGLTVLMLQRGDLPIVSVQAAYKVGSRNEPPGLSGAAHYVEHLAFRSTEGIARADLTNQILRWGGHWNGYTTYDRTTYASAVSSRLLEWLIFLERERMTRVRFTAGEVARERTSVIAELHQYEDWPPYALIDHRLRRAAFVAHPYGSPIMGWISDLQSVTHEELHAFYRTYYAPNNLVLVIVGQFDPDEAMNLVRRHFGDAPAAGRSPAIRTAEPVQQGERRVTLAGTGAVKHLELALHAPSAGDPDFATLLVADALLAGGRAPGRRAARPGSALDADLRRVPGVTRIVTEVETQEYPGLYSIGIEATADADLDAIERALASSVGKLAGPVPAARLRGAAEQVATALALEADSNRAVADLLATYEGIGSYTLIASIAGRLPSVTAEQIAQFAAARFAHARWNIGWFVPGGPSHAVRTVSAGAESHTTPAEPNETDRPTRRPPVSDLERPELPQFITRTLANGLTAVATGAIGDAASVRVRVEAGSVFDPRDRPGLAVVTARLLAGRTDDSTGEGADGQEPAVLDHTAFDQDAARANREFIEIEARLPRRALTSAIDRLAAMLARPTITARALDDVKDGLRSELREMADSTDWRATSAALAALYPASHPYSRPASANTDSIDRITLADVRDFFRRHVRPERTIVGAAAAADPERTLHQIERAFDGWSPQPDPVGAGASELPDAAPGSRVRVELPHQEQASIVVCLPGVARGDEDYAALTALNYLVGETGYAGRLGDALVVTGLTYSVYASVLAGRHAGPLVIETRSANADETVRRMLDVLGRLAQAGVTEAELREAQGFLLGRLLFRFESTSEATAALVDAAYHGASGDWSQFADRVRRLTVADLNRAAARYLDPARAAVATAGR